VKLGLGQLWLNPVDDLTNGVGFEVHDIEHDPAVNVRTDGYAGGNFRAVIVAGTQRTGKVSLSFCTDDQVAWLKDHQAALLCYRDPRGEKFYGIYSDLSAHPRQLPGSWAVTLTVLEVTVTEGVNGVTAG
jgi:hypothetical protein